MKARFVWRGYRDRDRRQLVHGSTTLKQQSVSILLAMADIFGFDVMAADVVQVYLQSATDLKRYVFVRPECIELARGELVKVVMPLYGLPDSGDYWNQTFRDHHRNDLRMQQTTGDFSLFSNESPGSLSEYVDLMSTMSFALEQKSF
jgi:hypothetical protein